MISLPVDDLPEPDRRSLENLLGHPLQSDQQVFVMVFSAGQVPDKAAREAAAERIRSTLADIDQYQKADGITGEEVDEAIVPTLDEEYIRQGLEVARGQIARTVSNAEGPSKGR